MSVEVCRLCFARNAFIWWKGGQAGMHFSGGTKAGAGLRRRQHQNHKVDAMCDSMMATSAH